MYPFKIAKGSDIAKVARDFFGNPSQETHMSDTVGLPSTTEIAWHFYDDSAEVNLSMTQKGDEILNIDISRRKIESDYTICGHYSPGNTINKLKKFIDVVSKPWEEWTDEEIMEHPAWIAMYKEHTGRATDEMESRMVMESYKDPNDKWVKKYFRS